MDIIQWATDLRSEDENRQQQATELLENSGPPSAADASSIAALLTDANADVVYWAATLLGRMEAKASPYTDALGKVLISSSADNARERAAWALGQIGPGAAAALPSLEKLANSASPRLARLSREAIKQIGG